MRAPSPWLPAVVLPLLACSLHLACINNYGYFRDELYYLACAQRPAWGYVDHPPLSVILLRLVTLSLGDALPAVRSLMVVSSGLTVLAVVATTRRLGATVSGQWAAGTCTLLSGLYLVIFSFYSMNGLDILFTAWIAWLVVRLIERDQAWVWLSLGGLFGVGMLNKASVLWVGLGLLLALLATPLRSSFRTIWPYCAVGLAAGLFTPHLIWQAANGWPTAEFARNAQANKLLPIAPWDFLAQQAVVANIVAFPLIVWGVVWTFRGGKRFLPLALVFLVVLAVLLVNGKSRVNYLAPAYTFVLPLAGAAVGPWLDRNRARRFGLAAAFAVTSPLYLGLGLPWLPPETMSALIKKSPLQPPVEEKGPKSVMQGWADMFGWRETAESVKGALAELTQEDRLSAVVVANNYGEAAALEHSSVARVACGHNSYWLWGLPEWDGRVAVFVNEWPDSVKSLFGSFEQVGRVDAPYAVPEQNGSPVWVARDLNVSKQEFWDKIKKYQ